MKEREEHEKYMRRCLELAALGLGHTSPNPMVGAVVVHQGRIIGEGYHHRCGEAHAEVNAIAAVQDLTLLKEATLYVSLEPCNHQGRTPACTDLILRTGIPRVVLAIQDPFPKVNGSGIERLRANGVEVTVGILAAEAEHLNRRFFTYHRHKRPYVVLKWAQTRDGYLDALRPVFRKNVTSETEVIGKALRISNDQSRYWLHRWRSEEDAILVGTQTAYLDNPSLTVRFWDGRNPIRLVLDRSLRLPLQLELFADASALTWVITDRQNKERASERFAGLSHVRVFDLDFSEVAKSPEGLVSPLLHLLYRQEIQSLLVEGGAQVLNGFLKSGDWDEIRIFKARKTLASALSISSASGSSVPSSSVLSLSSSSSSVTCSSVPGASVPDSLEGVDASVEGVKAPDVKEFVPQEKYNLGDNALWVYYRSTAPASIPTDAPHNT